MSPSRLRHSRLAVSGALGIAAALTYFGCRTPNPASRVKSDDLGRGSSGPSVNFDLKTLPGLNVPDVAHIEVETNNHKAFTNKLEAIKGAQSTIDAAYFIFDDYGYDHDYSAAAFFRELLAAATRGVQVRLIVDDGTTKKRRADFVALKDMALQAGKGDNLQIAYFRPYLLSETNSLKSLEVLANAAQPYLKKNTFEMANLTAIAQTLLDPVKLSELTTPEMLETYVGDALAAQEASQMATGFAQNGLSAFTSAVQAVFGYTPTSSGGFTSFMAAFLTKASGKQVADGDVQELLNISKRTHHKLLVVDGKKAMGGGRNMWDISNLEFDHPLRPEKLKNDCDTDYIVDDPRMAQATLVTFNEYWGCATGGQCASGLPLRMEPGSGSNTAGNAETAAPAAGDPNAPSAAALADAPAPNASGPFAASNAIWTSRIMPDAVAYDSRVAESRGNFPPVYQETIAGTNVPVTYIENRMFKDASAPGGDEMSHLLQSWAMLLDATGPGDEVLMQNAYFILPTETLIATVKALHRGVKFTFLANAAEISDNPIISQMGRMQAEAFMLMLKEIGHPELLDYYENSAFQQMHTKVSVIGDNLIVGSANADSRSAYLNTENAMVMGRGPAKVQWLSATGGAQPVVNGSFDSMAAAYLAMTKNQFQKFPLQGAVASATPGTRFRRLDLPTLQAALTASAVGKTALGFKILRSEFPVSVRLGLGMGARDKPDVAVCPNGKEGQQKAGCAMREWLYEVLLLQL